MLELLLVRVAEDSRFGGIIGLFGGIGGGTRPLLLFTGFAFAGKLLFFKFIDEFEICVFILAAIATTLLPEIGTFAASTAAGTAADDDGAEVGCSADAFNRKRTTN